MRPGSSSLSASTRLPCSCASVCRVPERDRRVDREQHPTGQERIAPEQSHEPRNSRRHHDAVRMVRIEHAEGTDVLGTGGQQGAESFFGGAHHRGGLAPGLVPGSGLAGFDGLTGPVARRGLNAVQRGGHLHTHGHVCARGDHQLPRNLSGYRLGLGIATDPHAATLGSELVADR